MKIAKLTHDGERFSVPVQEIYPHEQGVKGPNGTQYPANIFNLWTNEDLRSIGYVRVVENAVPEDCILVNTETKLIKNQLVLEHEYRQKPKEAAPIKSHAQVVAEGIMADQGMPHEDAVQEQLDAIFIWFEALHQQAGAIREAIQNIRIGGPSNEIQPGPAQKLIEALSPLLDPPQEVNKFRGAYKRVKGQ